MRTIKLCALLPALWLWLCATPTFGQDLLAEPLAQAQQANKLLFLDFTAKWCGICKQMEKTVFSQPEVARLLAERYVFVKIDYDTKGGRELYQSFGLNAMGLPVYLILDANRQVKAQRLGGMSVAETQQMLAHDYQGQKEVLRIKSRDDQRWLVGAQAGYNHSRFFTEGSAFAPAYHVGPVADYRLKKHTYLRMGLLLDHRRGHLAEDHQLAVHYLKMPLLVSLPLVNNTWFKSSCPQPIWLQVGAYASYALRARTDVGPGWRVPEPGALPRFDAGLRVGLALGAGSFEPSIGYEFGLPSLRFGNQNLRTGNIFFSITMVPGR